MVVVVHVGGHAQVLDHVGWQNVLTIRLTVVNQSEFDCFALTIATATTTTTTKKTTINPNRLVRMWETSGVLADVGRGIYVDGSRKLVDWAEWIDLVVDIEVVRYQLSRCVYLSFFFFFFFFAFFLQQVYDNSLETLAHVVARQSLPLLLLSMFFTL